VADAPKKAPSKASLAIAAAVLLSVPVTGAFEGLRTHPYRDPGDPRLWTVCYGETEREIRTYTAQECRALLNGRQEQDYGPAVLKCVPAFADERRRYAFAASIDAAYNAGIGAFCRSRMARAFNAGQWRQGCDGFLGWRATANGKVLRGLERRREAERALCLKGAA
jgi:lysozyme